jgi:hypothetical protein
VRLLLQMTIGNEKEVARTRLSCGCAARTRTASQP